MNPDVADRLNKADRAISAARLLVAQSNPDGASNRAYYAMFYAADALLRDRGLVFKKHSAIHAAFGEQFAKSALLPVRLHRYLIDAFAKRIQADYGVLVTLTAVDVEQSIAQAEEFVAAARAFLAAPDVP